MALDPGPFLGLDSKMPVVRNLELMPVGELLKPWLETRRKSVTIPVLHEGYLPTYPEFYRFGCDAVARFDRRHQRLFPRKFPIDHLCAIPYPCHPWQSGAKDEVRKVLGLPQQKKILIHYGIVRH